MDLQAKLPKARIVFASATGVSELKNMSYMTRLGLWGKGTAFTEFGDFRKQLEKRGVGALEMLAIEMKTQGMYVSRSLGFNNAEFVMDECDIAPGAVSTYNKAVQLWQDIHCELKQVPGADKGQGRAFWGAQQRFFKQMAISMKVSHVVARVRAALEEGFCVVIGLQTTGESSMEKEVQRQGGVPTGFISTTREMLLRFVEGFPEQDENGVPLPHAELVKASLMQRVKALDLPDAVLDTLVDQLGGADQVAEMTGRSSRMVRRRSGVVHEKRGDKEEEREKLNVMECKRFQAGEKRVAIISDAASTGISLHADARVKNQRRRMHITLELPWSADKAIQQLGRTHRTNATSAPLYMLCTTKLAGERRFIAAVAGRLQSLGALTKGDRRAASGQDLSEFNFGKPSFPLVKKALFR